MKYHVAVAATTALLLASNLSAKTSFVSALSTNPVAPFGTWAAAATNLQQAVTAAAAGDEIVVTDGVYGAIIVDKPIALRSVNGPQVTIIDATRQSRCASLTNGTSLSGFCLRNGADLSGGGVLCASPDVFLTNCLIMGNAARANSDRFTTGTGGGVNGGTLYNCMIVSNSAASFGGGAFASTLYNCTVIGNRADRSGGGVRQSTSTNCIVYYNTARGLPDNYSAASFYYSCTTPSVAGSGNISKTPEFVDCLRGDLRLLGVSPCIDAGDNGVVRTDHDFAGNPRVMRGKVDMGALEFQGTNVIAFYAWVQHHGVPIDGMHDYDDPDGDGMNNWQEWVCNTCPTNSLMNLRLVSAVPEGRDVVVRWKSSYGVKYILERTTNQASPFTFVASNLVGESSEFVYTDKNVPGAGPFFYRVGVKPGIGPTVWAPILGTNPKQRAAQ